MRDRYFKTRHKPSFSAGFAIYELNPCPLVFVCRRIIRHLTLTLYLLLRRASFALYTMFKTEKSFAPFCSWTGFRCNYSWENKSGWVWDGKHYWKLCISSYVQPLGSSSSSRRFIWRICRSSGSAPMHCSFGQWYRRYAGMFCPRIVIYHIFPNRIHKATSFFLWRCRSKTNFWTSVATWTDVICVLFWLHWSCYFFCWGAFFFVDFLFSFLIPYRRSGMKDAAIVLSVMSTPAQKIDSTMQMASSSLYHEHLPDIERMRTRPLLGRRFAIVKETIGWKITFPGIIVGWTSLLFCLRARSGHLSRRLHSHSCAGYRETWCKYPFYYSTHIKH